MPRPSVISRYSALLVLLALSAAVSAGVVLTEEEAPEWQVSEWVNGDPGSLADHRGRVVLIQFFQMWCPVSNDFTVPLFQRWTELYGSRDDILIVGLHSVFEGHDIQTTDALQDWLAERGIGYPVGIDRYAQDDPVTPVTMKLYRCEGSPQVVIVDKHGKLRFSHFSRFDPYVVEGLIDRLLKEIGPQPGRAKPAVVRPDPELSGRYRVTLAQTTKTCGRLIRPLTLDMELTVTGNELLVRSRQAYVGMNELRAKYDPATGRFDARATRRVSEQGTNVDVNLELQGLLRRGNPTEFEYTFSFDKSAPTPELNCRIDGRGKGTRVDPTRRR